MDSLGNFVNSTQLSNTQLRGRQLDVAAASLKTSRFMDDENFRSIGSSDLERIFNLYDDMFFDGRIRSKLRSDRSNISFRLSKRMTSAGGKTTRWQYGRKSDTRAPRFEIAISTTLLFESFQNGDPLMVTGLECVNRMQALQRVMEHEIIHLTEMLVWLDSSCSAPRFLKLANNFFGHREAHHELLTPKDKALSKFGIKVGDRVSFAFENGHKIGYVNRITRRATILVEDEKGATYSDGCSYSKFYVPIHMLKPA